MAESRELMTADFYLDLPKTEIMNRCVYQMPLKDLSGLGGGFAMSAATITETVKNMSSAKGLYRCVFPAGVSGELAMAKDGSGYLGTILNNGIVGQARWVPAEGMSAMMAVNPVTLAIAGVLLSVNQKMDRIQETEQEILNFLQQDKEAELESAVHSLSDIMNSCKFNCENTVWKTSQLTIVSDIKRRAEQNIVFYKKEINRLLGKQTLIHGAQKANKLNAQIKKCFQYYRLSVYLAGYSSFLEVLLGGNYSSEYLRHMSEKLRDYAYQYREDYTKTYDHIEGYLKTSVQSQMLSNLGTVSRTAGNVINKIPVISKGPVDELLIAAGDHASNAGENSGKIALEEFSRYRSAGVEMFVDNIEAVERLNNDPAEIYFDQDSVYLCV